LGSDGTLCGLHNTWDALRYTRHCVDAAAIAEFMSEHGGVVAT
jgi:hypothetical protein